jgi:hypothetical protein
MNSSKPKFIKEIRTYKPTPSQPTKVVKNYLLVTKISMKE